MARPTFAWPCDTYGGWRGVGLRHWIAGTHTGPVLSRPGFSHPPLFPYLNKLIPGSATDRTMLSSRLWCRWSSPVKLGSVLLDVEQREALRRRSRNSGRVPEMGADPKWLQPPVLSNTGATQRPVRKKIKDIMPNSSY